MDASFNSVFDAFQKRDWPTDTLNPLIGRDTVWLGNNSRYYTVRVVGMQAHYRFAQ